MNLLIYVRPEGSWEWMSNFITHFIMDVVSYPYWDWSKRVSLVCIPHTLGIKFYWHYAALLKARVLVFCLLPIKRSVHMTSLTPHPRPPQVPHKFVGEMGRHWFRQWFVTCLVPCHYLSQCRLIFNCQTFRPWNSIENVVCEMVAILSRGRWVKKLQWRHNGRDSISNDRRLGCLLKRLFMRRSKKTSKVRVTGLCEGNCPVTGGFPA